MKSMHALTTCVASQGEARAALASLLRKTRDDIRLSGHIADVDRDTVFHHACAMELEGIVAKRRDRTYRSGRCADWTKVKNREHRLSRGYLRNSAAREWTRGNGSCSRIEALELPSMNQPIRVLFLLTAVAVTTANAAGRRVAPSDVIQIHILNQPDLDTQVRVAPDGTISFPYVGRFRAEGLTEDEVAARIRAALSRAGIIK
jgi:hypothetical protein